MGDLQGHVGECLLCGNLAGNRVIFEVHHKIIECGECHLVYAAPESFSADRQAYTESYYRQGVYTDYLSDRPAIRKNARRVLTALARLAPGRTLLDVGCAAGFFLETAREQGWTVRGLEVSEYASAYAREQLQLEVDLGSITNLTGDFPKFDVVTLWDTIEHLDYPDIALENARRLIRRGGVLALSTGDYGSILSRMAGKRWRLFGDPTHRFFFDERTMKRLLSKAGYETISVTRRGKWVSLSMILHQSGLSVTAKTQKWLLSKGWNPSLYVNLRDVMTVFARPLE
jgi:SAM-dependent methyltransferase